MVASVLLAGYMTRGKVFYLKKHREETGRGELIWIPMPRVSTSDLRITKLDIVKALGSFDEIVSLTRKLNFVLGVELK